MVWVIFIWIFITGFDVPGWELSILIALLVAGRSGCVFEVLRSRASGVARHASHFVKRFILVFCFYFQVLNSRSSGVARQPVTFWFASLTLRVALQALRKLRCTTAKKVTKNAVSLTAKLNHDGCISQGFLSSSFREVIAKRYRGCFFKL